MNATRILIVALVVIAVGLAFNQWQIQRTLERLAMNTATRTDDAGGLDTDAKLRGAERRFNEAQAKLESADTKLAAAYAQIAQLDQRVRQLESGRPRRGPAMEDLGLRPATTPKGLEGAITNTIKRGWGPEQAAGPPDTMQAGDISTAWASREQDAGEEWLTLEYERVVDIAEVRVRETYNPGAISKVTAFLANGTEVILWEGTEPPSQAPVEMSFQVPSTTMAKTVKVYLDTTRVPGWNEIDAVAIIGRDGSTQWARQVTASSTYAEPRGGGRRLTEF